MRRVLFISGLAFCLWACGNGGNQGSQSDSSTVSPSGDAQRDPDTHSSSESGPGTGTGPGTGAAPVGENTPKNKAAMDSPGTQTDTTNRNQQ